MPHLSQAEYLHLMNRIERLENHLRNTGVAARQYAVNVLELGPPNQPLTNMFPAQDRSRFEGDLRRSHERTQALENELAAAEEERANLIAELAEHKKQLRRERARAVKARVNEQRARGVSAGMKAMAIEFWRRSWDLPASPSSSRESSGPLVDQLIDIMCPEFGSQPVSNNPMESGVTADHENVDAREWEESPKHAEAAIDRSDPFQVLTPDALKNPPYVAEQLFLDMMVTGGPQAPKTAENMTSQPETAARVNQRPDTPLYYKHGLFFIPPSISASDVEHPSAAATTDNEQSVQEQVPGWGRPLCPIQRRSSPNISPPPMSIVDEFTRPSKHNRMVIVNHLPNDITARDVLSKVRGGMVLNITMLNMKGFTRLNRYGMPLDSPKAKGATGKNTMGAMIFFYDGNAAKAWVDFVRQKPQMLAFPEEEETEETEETVVMDPAEKQKNDEQPAEERENDELITVFMEPTKEMQMSVEQPAEEQQNDELITVFMEPPKDMPKSVEQPAEEQQNDEMITVFMEPPKDVPKSVEQPAAKDDQGREEDEQGELINIYLDESTAQTNPSPLGSLMLPPPMIESDKLSDHGSSTVIASPTPMRPNLHNRKIHNDASPTASLMFSRMTDSGELVEHGGNTVPATPTPLDTHVDNRDPSPPASPMSSAMTDSGLLGQSLRTVLATASLVPSPSQPIPPRIQRLIDDGYTRIFEIENCPAHITDAQLYDVLRRDRHSTVSEIEHMAYIPNIPAAEDLFGLGYEVANDAEKGLMRSMAQAVFDTTRNRTDKGKGVDYVNPEVAQASSAAPVNAYGRARTMTVRVSFTSIEAASIAVNKLHRVRLFDECPIQFLHDPCAGPLEELAALL